MTIDVSDWGNSESPGVVENYSCGKGVCSPSMQADFTERGTGRTKFPRTLIENAVFKYIAVISYYNLKIYYWRLILS